MIEFDWTVIVPIGLSAGILIIAAWRAWIWHRDRAGEELEKIYQPLYSEIKTIMEQIKALKIPRGSFKGKLEFSKENWSKISQSRLITRIPSDTKKQLSEFYEEMLKEYLDLFSIVEKSIKHTIGNLARILFNQTLEEAVKNTKKWSWMNTYSSWHLDEALEDVLTPEIMRGKKPTDLDIDFLDRNLSEGIKNNLHPSESVKRFLQSLENSLEEDPGLNWFRQLHNRLVERGSSLIEKLGRRIRKMES